MGAVIVWVAPEHLSQSERALNDYSEQRAFSDADIVVLLERAQALRLPMGPGSPLEGLTVVELALLVGETRGWN